jgi:hypothetical protein
MKPSQAVISNNIHQPLHSFISKERKITFNFYSQFIIRTLTLNQINQHSCKLKPSRQIKKFKHLYIKGSLKLIDTSCLAPSIHKSLVIHSTAGRPDLTFCPTNAAHFHH